MAISTVISAGIHELGHILYLRKIGVSSSIRGVLSGFRIKAEKTISYKDDIRLYLAGPGANLIFALILSFISPFIDGYFTEAITVNIITALSNLLPIEGYDGYGALHSAIQEYDLGDIWESLLRGLSCLLIFLLCIVSLYFIDRFGGGYWIFVIFFISTIKELSKRLDKANSENS